MNRPVTRTVTRFALALLLLLLATESSIAQRWPDTGADAVESFTPGTGAGYGAGFLPRNVLGLPDSNARLDVASVDPAQILSLGLGGEIILRFDREPIVDREGEDFTVFENAFDYTIGGQARRYAEPAEVSVSRDGVTWLAFPFDSLTLRGCAGVTPTQGDQNPGDPLLSGGDSFDLRALGVDSARYVRLRDRTAMVKANRSSPYWDITLNGFDLDAVVRTTVAHPLSVSADVAKDARVSLQPNPTTGRGHLRLEPARGGDVTITLMNILGEEVIAFPPVALRAGANSVPLLFPPAVPDGLYFLVIAGDGFGRSSVQLRLLR